MDKDIIMTINDISSMNGNIEIRWLDEHELKKERQLASLEELRKIHSESEK